VVAYNIVSKVVPQYLKAKNITKVGPKYLKAVDHNSRTLHPIIVWTTPYYKSVVHFTLQYKVFTHSHALGSGVVGVLRT